MTGGIFPYHAVERAGWGEGDSLGKRLKLVLSEPEGKSLSTAGQASTGSRRRSRHYPPQLKLCKQRWIDACQQASGDTRRGLPSVWFVGSLCQYRPTQSRMKVHRIDERTGGKPSILG